MSPIDVGVVTRAGGMGQAIVRRIGSGCPAVLSLITGTDLLVDGGLVAAIREGHAGTTA
jgi:hypothetical protein